VSHIKDLAPGRRGPGNEITTNKIRGTCQTCPMKEEPGDFPGPSRRKNSATGTEISSTSAGTARTGSANRGRARSSPSFGKAMPAPKSGSPTTTSGWLRTPSAPSSEALGIQAGERVCLFMDKVPELYLGFLGILKIGAIAQPCSSAFGDESLFVRLSDAETSP